MNSPFSRKLFTLLWILSLFYADLTLGAPCCGGSVASPTLISDNSRAKITGSFNFTSIGTDVSMDGIWRDRNEPESLQSITMSSAYAIAERWQVGLRAPFLRRDRDGSSSSGVGDLSATIAYEALLNWEYHPWRPEIRVYLSMIAPTGRPSILATDKFALEARGRGFWSAGAGFLATRAFREWDFLVRGELQRPFARSFTVENRLVRLVPGLTGTFGAGGGYSIGSLRIGLGIDWTIRDRIQRQGFIESPGFIERFATGSASLSYFASDENSYSLVYSDQSSFGSPVNTSLEKGVAFSWTRSWLR